MPKFRLSTAIKLMVSTGPSWTACPACTAIPTKLCNCRTESFPVNSLLMILINLPVASTVSTLASLTEAVNVMDLKDHAPPGPTPMRQADSPFSSFS